MAKLNLLSPKLALAALWGLIVGLLPGPSVSSILSDFTKKADKLDKVAERANTLAAKEFKAAEDAETAAQEALAERDRAVDAAAIIRGLFGSAA